MKSPTKRKEIISKAVEHWMLHNCLGNLKAKKKSDIQAGLLLDHNIDISERVLRMIMSELRKEEILCSNSIIGWWYMDLGVEGETLAILQGAYEKRAHALTMLTGINKLIAKYEGVLKMKKSDLFYNEALQTS